MQRGYPATIPDPRKSPIPPPPAVATTTSGDAAALSISDQRTLYLVNIFIANTARFLNSFSAICEQKLLHVHRRILRLDATLTLLEAQLKSIDGVGKSEDCGGIEVAELSNQLEPHDSSTFSGSSEQKDGNGKLSSAADITQQKTSIFSVNSEGLQVQHSTESVPQ